jgi:hypothetical protein
LKRANQMRLHKDSDDTDYDMLEPDNDDILSLHTVSEEIGNVPVKQDDIVILANSNSSQLSWPKSYQMSCFHG